jgi:hypothetical protein
MQRSNKRKLRISLFVKAFNSEGKRVLSAKRRVPDSFLSLIKATPAAHFMIKICYGHTGQKREIINEMAGCKKEVLHDLRVLLSNSELDATERYWGLK